MAAFCYKPSKMMLCGIKTGNERRDLNAENEGHIVNFENLNLNFFNKQYLRHNKFEIDCNFE